jgi:hypothetical protein
MNGKNRVPYTAFGKTKLVPLRVYVNGKPSDQKWFQQSFWIERGEDWYAFGNKSMQVPTLVVERLDWLKSPDFVEETYTNE